MPRTLGADSIMNLARWVDASYAVHVDMRSHTGGCMSFGLGVLMPKSAKQKLDAFEELDGTTLGTTTTPANKGLFVVNPDKK